MWALKKTYHWNIFNCCCNGHFHWGILHDIIKTGCLRNEASLGGFCHLLISAEMEGSTEVDRRKSSHNAEDLQMTPHLCSHEINKTKTEKTYEQYSSLVN